MWDQSNKLLNSPNTQSASSINPGKASTEATIENVIDITDRFWNTMHPSYQKIYDIGSNFAKTDISSDSAIIQSLLTSLIEYYKLQLRNSDLTLEEKEEEQKKIELLTNNISQISDIIRFFKIKLDENALLAYLLGYGNNLYKRNKS